MTRSDEGLLKVFEPRDPVEAAQGWALHTTRRRRIHEDVARHLDRWRQWLGTLSAVLAAIAGTSAFAAWQGDGDSSTAAAVITAIVGIGAAILASVLTFLDLGGRAEAHRRAAAAYKAILRDYEERWAVRGDAPAIDGAALSELKAALDKADESAPTVPLRRGEQEERLPFVFVDRAEELARRDPPEA